MASPSGQSLSCFNTPRMPIFSQTGITEKIGEIVKRVINIHKNGIFPTKCSMLEEAVNYFLDNGSQSCRWWSDWADSRHTQERWPICQNSVSYSVARSES